MGLLIKTTPSLSSISLWSGFGTITITTVANTLALPFIEIDGIRDGATLVRATALLKFRVVAETSNNAVSLQDPQTIQAQKAVAGAWVDGIYLLNQQIGCLALTREFGDVFIGTEDISAQVPSNGEDINFQWIGARTWLGEIDLEDLQMGLTLWFM